MIYCASTAQLCGQCSCPAWHLSLTAAQSKALEAIQRRSMRIILTDSDYKMALMLAGLDPLESRRARLTERFFRRIYEIKHLSSSRLSLMSFRMPAIFCRALSSFPSHETQTTTKSLTRKTCHRTLVHIFAR